jgi:multiple sugar transport system ATP-binding protein
VVGIRPEHLTVADGDADPARTIAVRVELVEALGNESLVHFSTDARRVRNKGGAWTPDEIVEAAGAIAGASAGEGVARVDPGVAVAPGDRVALAVDVGRLHYFDAETGDAIGSAARPATAPHEIPPRREERAREHGEGIGNVHR